MRNNETLNNIVMFTSSGLLFFTLQSAAVDIKFHGTLIEPPACAITNSNQISVNFGDQIKSQNIDGVNYRQKIDYQVFCENVEEGRWALSLSLEGETSKFDNDALTTSKDGLGIRIYLNDTPFTPNSVELINPNAPINLEAVLIKKNNVVLSEGVFNAVSTLHIYYQ